MDYEHTTFIKDVILFKAFNKCTKCKWTSIAIWASVILMIILFFIPSVNAISISGGETWVYNFPECDELRVTIIANLTIHDGEYTILNDCEGGNNSFVCDCTNDFDFNVSFKINTINSYTFDFNYDYSREFVETVSGSTGGGGGGIFSKHLRTGIPFKAVLVSNLDSYFYFNGVEHTMKVINYTENHIELSITSEPLTVKLTLNETKEIDFEDGILRIYFLKIKRNVVTLMLTSLEKPIKEIKTITISEVEEIDDLMIIDESLDEIAEEVDVILAEEEEKKSSPVWVILGIVGTIILLVIVFFYMIPKWKKQEED